MDTAVQQTAPIIEIEGLHKSFQVGVQEIKVLKGIDASISYGDFAIIIGPSGCGKSTLLHIILGLEPPSEGKIKFLNEDLYLNTQEDDRSDFRKKHVGMVYQQANWIKSLTVMENVAFPLLLLGVDKPKAMAKAYEMLKRVNMEEWGDYIPTELSGGQQQRVALARALINNPEIIIADEPTGNLDYEAGQMIMALLANLNRESGKTIIMVTHDLEYITFAKKAISMVDGLVVGIYNEDEKEKLMHELRFKRIGDIKKAAEGEDEQEQAQEKNKTEPEAQQKTPNESEPEKAEDNHAVVTTDIIGNPTQKSSTEEKEDEKGS